MAGFFGRYEHSLDAKGRVILPARFRPHFELGGHLSKHYDGCLALWTPDAFDRQMATMETLLQSKREDRNLARVWAAGSQEVEADKQGRIAIPASLRAYAHLETEVLITGAIDRVELWAPEVWRAVASSEEERLLAGVTSESVG
ncbi:MAG: division/cell wall cluster transcriptional repressor MraZ [Actinobacteria bacterium]|nr:division/cell wall cluster transcriptional repressor MraZ [Actinomycetota bacterium]